MNKKSLIAATAKKLFALNGFAATSVDDIAKPCNVTKSSLYYHFKDKYRLYEYILENDLKRLADAVVENVWDHDDPEERLARYIETFSERFHEDRDLASIFMREMSNGGDGMPAGAMKQMLRTLSVLAKIIGSGVDAGRFARVEPILMQMMIVGTLSFLVNTENLRRRVRESMPDADGAHAVIPVDDATPQIVRMALHTLKGGLT